MCRLSIIVPYDRDEAAFETTLVSVLENRPEFCEVVVVHDGSYDDPFELGDEVRFVVAERADALGLIESAVANSLGRIVHVLRGGARATEDWTEEPLELFEQSDLAAVAPLMRELTEQGHIVAAGWKGSLAHVMAPIAKGTMSPSRKDLAAIDGTYLSASFWRRSTLDALLTLTSGQTVTVAEYTWAMVARAAGWRCRVASESTVLASPQIVSHVCSHSDAATIQGLRQVFAREGMIGGAIGSLLGWITQPFAAGSLPAATGRLMASLGASGLGAELARQGRQLAKDIGPDAAQATILKMPVRSDFGQARRAA